MFGVVIMCFFAPTNPAVHLWGLVNLLDLLSCEFTPDLVLVPGEFVSDFFVDFLHPAREGISPEIEGQPQCDRLSHDLVENTGRPSLPVQVSDSIAGIEQADTDKPLTADLDRLKFS